MFLKLFNSGLIVQLLGKRTQMMYPMDTSHHWYDLIRQYVVVNIPCYCLIAISW